MSPQYDPEAPTEIARIADLFGFSTRRANQILAAAGVARVDRGRVPLKAAVQACLRSYRADLTRRRARSADGERLLQAKAREIEARNERTDARLIDVEEHREIATETFARLRRHLADVPAAAGLDDDARQGLKAEIERITREAEQRFDKLTEEVLPPTLARARR
jgi:hypothetical protein